MTSTYLKVMRPAQVTVGPHIKKIAIVNRTVPEKKAVNIIEGILTGEMPGRDKQGVQKAIDGLQESFINSPRFEVIRTNEELKGSGIGDMLPTPLNWTVITDLCKKYQVDAILAVENYDSDFIITKGDKINKKVNEKGDTIKVLEYYAEGIATVNLGYRLYDPQKKAIVDQLQNSNKNKWNTKGNSVQDALVQLIDANTAIQRVSFASGGNYGSRITPNWVSVRREFYKKNKRDSYFTIGSRKAQVNDWNGAADYWLKATQSRSSKVAGKACYNLALAYEVLGDLDGAKKWVTTSYADYGNKKARRYSYLIDGRIWEMQKLNEQMSQAN
ncbi:hypothetical protein GXP67_20490 [Rhodocytophaga rosea]|uniref:Tetratricopeptide repeat protein n=1 Tax=Rhodocytophaga rosea TaxID=2704465 RepID=A0A6C0GLE2_9BACT|nr:DUF6340 family protein [Rhodocytophaga rosea]QHT68856.1 hypothetical protein GXP67_20490 [Rhodocytophaga rosea]